MKRRTQRRPQIGAEVLLGTILMGLTFRAVRGAGVDLRSDPRLSRTVSLHAPMTSLGRLVPELGKQAEVVLAVSAPLKSRSVTFTARNRPMREVMEQLALALDYTWTAAADRTYQLTEGPEARSRRLQLRARIRTEEGAELRQYLADVGKARGQVEGLPLTERFANAGRVDAEAKALPIGPERARKEREAFAAYDAAIPFYGPLVQAATQLPPVIQQRLWAGERVVLAHGRPGSLPLAPELAEALVASCRNRMGQLPPAPPLPGVERLALDLRVESQLVGATLRIRATAPWGDTNPPSLGMPRIALTSSRARLGPDLETPFPGSVTIAPGVDPARRVQFLALPPTPLSAQSSVWTYVLGATAAEFVDRAGRSAPDWAIVGDAHFRPWTPDGPAGSPPVTRENLARILPAFAAGTREGGAKIADVGAALAAGLQARVEVTPNRWLRIRSAVYPLEDETSVDPRTVQEVLGPLVQEKFLRPGVAEQAARRLTLRQVATLLRPGLGFAPGEPLLAAIQDGWAGWRLLGCLSKAGKEAVLAGESVPCRGFHAADRAAVLTFLREGAEMYGTLPLDLLLDATDVPRLALKLENPQARSGARRLELWLAGWGRPLCSLPLSADWTPEAPKAMP